jgi:D-amino-acid oxidase
MKIAVIGGGLFGSTIAIFLAREGHQVELFERNDELLKEASGINQYRLHAGYHYPRSKETAISSKRGIDSFLAEYGDCMLERKMDVEHYYAISAQDSLVDRQQYADFMDSVKLPYREASIEGLRNVEGVFQVEEQLIDINALKRDINTKVDALPGILLKLNTEFDCATQGDYDYVVSATYANYNFVFKDPEKKVLQFELVEKPVIKLPDKFRTISLVVMDGPFFCLDPYGDTGLHVMGNVTHAIHQEVLSQNIEIPYGYRNLVNRGIVRNPSITTIDLFRETARHFFDGLEFDHFGSMYTVRAVLPNRDHDDARPTIVNMIDEKFFHVFSGKLGTSVETAHHIVSQLVQV